MKNKNIYIIGDVHGCYKTLLALIKQLPKNAENPLVARRDTRGSKTKLDYFEPQPHLCAGAAESLSAQSAAS